jgi:hypothetical protein
MRFLVATVALVSLAGAAAAEPDPSPPPVGWSVAAGVATALVPMAVGGALLGMGSSLDEKDAGIYLIQAGLILAPFVSHAIAGEWKRAAIFASIPAVAAATAIGLTAATPDVVTGGDRDYQKGLGVVVAVAVVASMGGVVDSLWAAERKKASQITVAPLVGKQQVGLMFGGSL